MTANPSSRNELSAFLRQQIDRAKAVRTVRGRELQGSARRRLLREWQQERLSRTYRDLLDSPHFGLAAAFFLSDLYGLKDTSARDAAVERLYPTMARLLPEAGLHSIGLALELDALSEELDAQLLDALEDKLALRDRILEADYCEAYRRCDNYALRKHQIELFCGVGDTLARAVAKPLIYSLLRRMRRPARLAGFGELQDFLERGLHAFQHMKDPAEFLETIERRETQILERIYACHPHPFDLDPARSRGA